MRCVCVCVGGGGGGGEGEGAGEEPTAVIGIRTRNALIMSPYVLNASRHFQN